MNDPLRAMNISRNEQVSLPAEARARWKTRCVIVGLGDRIVMRPMTGQPIEELRGKYRGRGPSSDHARQQERQDDVERAEIR